LIKTAFQLTEYLKYWLVKEDRYSLQSPFVYKRYCDLLDYLRKEKKETEFFQSKKQDSLKSTFPILSFGDQCKNIPGFGFLDKKIKYQLLCQYFCNLTSAETVLEIRKNIKTQDTEIRVGSSNAIISASYQEPSNSDNYRSKKTLEIDANNMNIAAFPELKLPKSVDFGVLDKGLSDVEILTFFSQLEPIINPKSILIISNIHESPQINKAWREIISHKKIKLSLDFYVCGVLFFEYPSEKKNFVLDF